MRYHWFVFCQGDLLLERHPDGTSDVPFQEEPPTEVKSWTAVHDLTMPDGEVVKTYSIDSPVTGHPLYEMTGLRQSYHLIPSQQYVRAGKCYEILYWDSTTKFCGVCGGPMKVNLRADETFVEDEGWHAASERYTEFIRRHKDGKVLFLDLGSCGNTPVIFKIPFIRWTMQNPNAIYATVNLGEAFTVDQIADRSIVINGDIGDILEKIL
jgi:hypothetical protein